MESRITVIAEAGVNHNGSLDLALKLVRAASESGADIVKFQTFRSEKLVTRSAKKAEYAVRNMGSGESQYEMLKRLELSPEDHEVIFSECRKLEIEFLSTPFDFESVALLSDRFKLPCLKISSGDLSNAPLLLDIARRGLMVILSTGMSTLGEVEQALGALAFGYLGISSEKPGPEAFSRAMFSKEGYLELQKKVTVLHCTTEYPAPPEEVNLRAIQTLRQAFGLRTGFSDHTQGIAVPISAVALGAEVIEKHFTLDRSLPGPDHQASLIPGELRQMVEGIRQVEQALGTGVKGPTPSEIKNRIVARKSLVVSASLNKGGLFSAENLTVKRPGSGISPIYYWDTLGKKANRDFVQDELVEL